MQRIRREPFGATRDGREVERFTLENSLGMCVSVLSLGGIVQSVRVPDRRGVLEDVALGFDTVDEYLADPRYIGALIGRYANRIAGGRFMLDGTEYSLRQNDSPNHLHGGPEGFHRAHWAVEPVERTDAIRLQLRYVSVDGEEGYPGTLAVTVTYDLTDRNEFAVTYRAVTDKATPVNLTFHGYFNLAGNGIGNVLEHELTLGASWFTPVNASLIPTGELRTVRGTPFDFRMPTAIGARQSADDEQLAFGRGYDHNFVIGDVRVNDLAFAARLYEPYSGRWLEIHTTEPGVQLYAGTSLGGTGKGGCSYGPHAGLALETQHFPNSPNDPSFPSTILRPGQTFVSRTVYKFGAL